MSPAFKTCWHVERPKRRCSHWLCSSPKKKEKRESRRASRIYLLDGTGAQDLVAIQLLDRLDLVLPDGDLGRERLLEGLQSEADVSPASWKQPVFRRRYKIKPGPAERSRRAPRPRITLHTRANDARSRWRRQKTGAGAITRRGNLQAPSRPSRGGQRNAGTHSCPPPLQPYVSESSQTYPNAPCAGAPCRASDLRLIRMRRLVRPPQTPPERRTAALPRAGSVQPGALTAAASRPPRYECRHWRAHGPAHPRAGADSAEHACLFSEAC